MPTSRSAWDDRLHPRAASGQWATKKHAEPSGITIDDSDHESDEMYAHQMAWSRSGFSARAAHAWSDAGFDDPAVARAWFSAGYAPEPAADWRMAIQSDDPAAVEDWASVGFRDPARVASWLADGNPPPPSQHRVAVADLASSTDPAVPPSVDAPRSDRSSAAEYRAARPLVEPDDVMIDGFAVSEDDISDLSDVWVDHDDYDEDEYLGDYVRPDEAWETEGRDMDAARAAGGLFGAVGP